MVTALMTKTAKVYRPNLPVSGVRSGKTLVFDGVKTTPPLPYSYSSSQVKQTPIGGLEENLVIFTIELGIIKGDWVEIEGISYKVVSVDRLTSASITPISMVQLSKEAL